MRIALDGTPLQSAPYTGIARYTQELQRALIELHPEAGFTLESRPELHGLLEGRWWSIGLPRRLRETGVTLFHGTDFAVPLLGKTPSVVTVHDLSPLRAREWKMPATARRVARRLPGAISRSRAVIAPSERVKREIVETFQTPPEKIFVTPLAPARAFQTITKREPPARPYLLYVGSGQERKNLHSLTQVWDRLRAHLKIDLVAVGQNLPFTLEWGIRAMEKIPDEELAVLYSHATAFVYPSVYEGFGLPVVEAMACGAPVITWRDTASSDVAGGAGLEAGSEDELASAIQTIVEQPELAAELQKKSLARAACFSWQKTARKTWEAYESAISGS